MPSFFAQLAAPGFDRTDINVPSFVTAYDAQLRATPLAVWKTYLRFHVVDSYARTLPKRFVDAAFGFRSGVLYGVTEQLPRWQRCTSGTDNALQKLGALIKKFGYPDTWLDDSTLAVDAGVPYAGLVQRVRRWDVARYIQRIGKPTDRTLWARYGALAAMPGVKTNGKMVQGEAIADLGGTTLAFKAFSKTAEYRAQRASTATRRNSDSSWPTPRSGGRSERTPIRASSRSSTRILRTACA